MRLSKPPKATEYAPISSSFQSLGGAAAFAALALAANSVEVTVLGPEPQDEYANAAQALFAYRGIRWTGFCKTPKMPVFYSIYEPSGTRWVIHEDCLFESEWLPDRIDAEFVMLYPTAPETAREMAELASDNATSLIFSPSGSLLSYPETFEAIARKACWVILNQAEVVAYTQTKRSKEALAALSRLCPNVVVTGGEQGSVLLTDGASLFVSTSPVRSFNSAGDGDVLAAVFSTGVFAQRLPPLESLKNAQAVVTRFLRRGEVPLESTSVFDLLSL